MSTGDGEQPQQHLYAAVSDARDNVVNSFDEQRTAIRQAVDDQRQAALAPIHAARAKRRGASNTATTQQMAELVLLLRQMVAEEVRRELDRRGAQFSVY